MKLPTGKKIKLKKIKISTLARYITIVFLLLILIISSVSTYASFQKPTTTKESYTTLSYIHSGRYDYIVYLKNNTVYNKTVLHPGEGIIFKKIVENITISYTYSFNINKTAAISGSYVVQAEIKTDLWTKNYIIKPSTKFNTNGTRSYFTVNFPLNTTIYENIVKQIESEIGITSSNPSLIIKTNVFLTAQTADDFISTPFSSSISISLGKKTIEISDQLSLTESGSGIRNIYHPDVITARSQWSVILISILIVTIFFLILTESETRFIDENEKTIQSIIKKYKEWIVEVDSIPSYSNIIPVKTIDDLVKIGDEIVKPILHYTAIDGKHIFYILDEDKCYQFSLQPELTSKSKIDLIESIKKILTSRETTSAKLSKGPIDNTQLRSEK